ncbi:MAG: GNAT family N-acetyltransferase [Halieaceae bacterium]|jgi:GNAT superfamily N-acetyltransferase|nr:GNAT family N-acetyltransferase [Halieaceae bacterium]
MASAPPTIMSAQAEDSGVIADILADAFQQDPCMNWAVPLPAIYRDFYRFLATSLYLPNGLVFMDDQQRAAAMWLPPGADHRVPVGARQLSLVLRLVLKRGPGVLSRLNQAQAVMEQHHPREPHYYLHAIGARRSQQGRGLGSALLKHMTQTLDAERVPAYLESSSPQNLSLYQRHGFEVTGEAPLGPGGPTLHFMWREPRETGV